MAAPTLLIAGSEDHAVIRLNQDARERMNAPAELHIVPGAGHLFEEPGALEAVARVARSWFKMHLARRCAPRSSFFPAV